MKTATGILQILRNGSQTSSELATQLQSSEREIVQEINQLQKMGYHIESIPQTGYRLLESPDLLIAEDIESFLTNTRLPWRILTFQQTTSTNDIVHREARHGAGEGLVVFTESQTAGRGRLGRRWQSLFGKGLWFSVLLKPSFSIQQLGKLTAMAALAVTEGLEKVCSLKSQIKWPNDIWIGQHKIAGILTEAETTQNHIGYAIIGIGVNVHHQQKDFDDNIRAFATSVYLSTGHQYRRAELGAAILEALAYYYFSDFNRVRDLWQRRCLTVGRWVLSRQFTQTIEGTAESIDENGHLLVRSANGSPTIIHSGDAEILS